MTRRRQQRAADHHAGREPGDARPPQPRGHLLVLLGLALVGLVLSGYLTYVHRRLQLEPGWRSACAINALLDCDAVALSPYAAVGGVPVAALAAWFYGALALVCGAGLSARRVTTPRSPAPVLFLAGVCATGVSVVLAGISGLVIRAFCIVCMALYAVNLGLLAVGWRAQRRTGEPLGAGLAAEAAHLRRHRRPAVHAGSILVALAAVVAFFYLFGSRAAPRAERAESCREAAGGAPVELAIYSDYQCEFCRSLHLQLAPLRRNARVRVHLRHYPLDATCNLQVRRSRHPAACLQARAAICADEQGRLEPMSDALFERGPRDEQGLRALAASLGLDARSFAECLVSEASARRLRADVAAAVSAGVRATPSVVLDGARHEGLLPREALECLARGGRPWFAKEDRH